MNVFNLTVRFILELCGLAALAYGGFTVGQGTVMKLALGLGLPLMFGFVWGRYRVPNDPGPATVAISGRLRLLIEVATWAAAAIALLAAGQPTLALIFALAVMINNVMMAKRLTWLMRQ
jgi:hypothetical protein